MKENHVRIRIRTLIPISGILNSRISLDPGDYDADAVRSGIITVSRENEIFNPKPGQFVFLTAPEALLDYYRAAVALVKAQAEYNSAQKKWEKILMLTGGNLWQK